MMLRLYNNIREYKKFRASSRILIHEIHLLRRGVVVFCIETVSLVCSAVGWLVDWLLLSLLVGWLVGLVGWLVRWLVG